MQRCHQRLDEFIKPLTVGEKIGQLRAKIGMARQPFGRDWVLARIEGHQECADDFVESFLPDVVTVRMVGHDQILLDS